jgi:hypothetical protein
MIELRYEMTFRERLEGPLGHGTRSGTVARTTKPEPSSYPMPSTMDSC